MGVRGLAVRVVVLLCAVLGVLSLGGASASAAGGEAGLIDGRGWELVSPVDKHGAGIEALANEGVVQAAEGGGGIAYLARAPIVADPAGSPSPLLTQILSVRGPGGWSSQDISPPHEATIRLGQRFAEDVLFSPDLSAALVEPLGDTPLPPLEAGAEKTIYLRNDATGSYLPLVTAANVLPGRKIGEEYAGELIFEGASPDLSHVVFISPEGLTANTQEGQPGLYEWAAGKLQLVSVLPDGEPAGVGTLFLGGAPGGSSGVYEHNLNVRHAISTDGSRVVWLGNRHLYLRDVARGETIKLDRASESESGFTEFQFASNDGSRVFFTEENELYVFEVAAGGGPLSGTLRNLTAGTFAERSAVNEIAGGSEDGSYVYFGSTLTMVHYNGVEWEAPKVVAPADFDFARNGASQLAVRVSPNGRYLTFMSSQSLTGYDNRDAVSGEPDEEVYIYDAATGRIGCVSCDPSGARPTGIYDQESASSAKLLVDLWGTFGEHWLAGSIPSWMTAEDSLRYQSRFLSDDGRLFFASPVALVPGDVNGKEDVYEYEPVGVGGCGAGTHGARVVFSESAGGCVGLISSGMSGEESAFLDASSSGGDVFFVTSQGLVPEDVDGGYDVYDAHECTSASPCLAPVSGVSSPPCATAEACHGSSSGVVFGSPVSASFSGAGNLAPPAPTTAPTPKPRAKVLSRAQKLARALKACRKKSRGKRAVCEKRARRSFAAGTSTAGKATARSGR
jgi:hypothetical protein